MNRLITKNTYSGHAFVNFVQENDVNSILWGTNTYDQREHRVAVQVTTGDVIEYYPLIG